MGLRIHAAIPYGNVCETAITRDGATLVVEFTADPHGAPEALWFCFRIEQDGPEPVRGPVKLVLNHLGTLLAGLTPHLPENLRPVMRPAGGDWQRLESGREELTHDGRRRAVWMIEAPPEYSDIALCYPYGRDELQQLLADTGDYWHCDSIGVSQGARSLLRLSNDVGDFESRRPGVYLIARQHSGETPGSWVLDGLLRRFAEHGEAAPLTWCLPLSNIDGIEQGDYGKDNYPYDLARGWGRWPMRHETLILQRDLRLWAARCAPLMALDFHAPGPGEIDGIYAFLRWSHEPPEAGERVARWGEIFAEALGEYAAPEFSRIATHGGRWTDQPTFKEFCHETLDTVSLALECPYSLARTRVLQRADYREAGNRFADALIANLPA